MFSSRTLIFLGVILLVAVIGAGGWWYWVNRAPQLDALMRQALTNAETVTSYAQHVETETNIEDRHIRVVGDYLIDDTAKNYSSLATTVLTLPDGSSHAFTLHSITIGEDMFTKVQSQSTALNLTVPSSPEWKQFKINAIPTEYRDIATPRPPLDNLTLFRGDYLVLEEGRKDETVNGESLARYTFKLSSKAFTEKTGPVSMIAERVGVHGTVHVWVKEPEAQIRIIHFSNYPYFSTTTVSYINALPAIVSPLPVAN